ncbi:MAG: acyl-CoA thioesterase [Hydrocarboniphaga sp.]|uniref:acyl-CoA thioesterase n=1 Tax=Hydrocarboniphaga sp. TaxID=2033016 RepID=UPI00261F532F|nr:acyl-CoA thioesterase [Hydrocarboniphaga sp.]MDB5968289.1 acyl-CoA thioesterase [Hydrocarboniphaga sp.]
MPDPSAAPDSQPPLSLARRVADSAVREQVYMIFPNDLNNNDTVFGGLIMSQMDRLCAVVADRHAGAICSTVGVDAVHFLKPARRGDVLIFSACVNRAWNTSMEIGCRVEAETIAGLDRRHILSAYLTFVAQNSEGRPHPVPALVVESDQEKRRYGEAQLRRESRLAHSEALKRLRAPTTSEP